MRETRTAQQSIFQSSTDHEIARELKRMSDWLDEHPELLEAVAKDLCRKGGSRRGRSGMTVDGVLRCAILKQYRQVDYRTLAFYLRDSVSFVEFARVDQCRPPSKSTLQSLVSAIRSSTWESLQLVLLGHAGPVLELLHDLQGFAISLCRRVPVFLEGFDFPQVGVAAGFAQLVAHLGHDL